MRLGDVRAQGNGPFNCRPGVDVLARKKTEIGLRRGHQRPGPGVTGINFGCAAAKPDGYLVAPDSPEASEETIVSRHEIELVGFRVARPTPLDRLFLFR